APARLKPNEFERKPRSPSLVRIIICGWDARSNVSSTNQLELSQYPPTTNPRARMVALVGADTLVIRHPPGVRSPAPSAAQSELFVDISKPARQTSGQAPLRSHVMVEPSNRNAW